jgi:hypothetical protein
VKRVGWADLSCGLNPASLVEEQIARSPQSA